MYKEDAVAYASARVEVTPVLPPRRCISPLTCISACVCFSCYLDPQAGVDVAETLTPYRACAYSWDEPLGERALVVERLVGSAADKKPRSRRGGRRSPTDRGSAEAATEAFEPAPNGTGATTGERVDEIRWRSFSTAFVGVYGLDLIRPPAVVGNLRIGASAS